MIYTVCIIGAGNIAQEHLEALKNLEEVRAVAIADKEYDKVKRASSLFHVNGYTDYKEMIKQECPDITIITLPHFLHKEAAVFCAEQKSHILLEKPMALTVWECKDIIKATEKNGVKLMVGHTQHYFIENIVSRKIIQSRELGELVQINESRHMHYFTPERPKWFLEKEKAGGGVMMNLGAHSVDKILWMTDSFISTVRATLTYHSKYDVDASALVWAETSTNIPITISISGYKGARQHVTELIFKNGMVKVEVGKGVWIAKDDHYETFPLPEQLPVFQGQILDLVEAIKGKQDLELDGGYGVSIVQVLESIYQSDALKKPIQVKNQ
ncbi:gfo/Idh/MocA family oxidoreductase [Pontibacillus yanchengensis]|uniref:Gfo/Idh/MocA family oxidoreductase n=1 Tax=Pontibacillus yanchengensis TaxID=462910 RepID=A0A6I4ZUR6_9BACI|nr:gfo/Idh/MocA family oxidoreductase [Pontibacillus yanchengensis]